MDINDFDFNTFSNQLVAAWKYAKCPAERRGLHRM